MLSSVAGILDPKGGFRVVVTERWRMRFHLAPGEKLFVVPGYRVQEPIPWNDIPWLIRRVELYVEWWISTRNDPAVLRSKPISNYLKNPNAYHNLEPAGYHYLDVPGRKIAAQPAD